MMLPYYWEMSRLRSKSGKLGIRRTLVGSALGNWWTSYMAEYRLFSRCKSTSGKHACTNHLTY